MPRRRKKNLKKLKGLNCLEPLLLTLVSAWISSYIHHKVWDEITYPFPNVNGATVDVLGMDK